MNNIRPTAYAKFELLRGPDLHTDLTVKYGQVIQEPGKAAVRTGFTMDVPIDMARELGLPEIMNVSFHLA